MFERFVHGARRAVELAEDQSGSLGHNYIGTEHLLMGLVAEREGLAARVLSSFGITEESLRTQVAKIIGPVDPPPMDPDALATIGIDLAEVRRRVEEAFGPGALERTRAGCITRRPPFTDRAKKALELALRAAVALRHGHVDTEHILLGLVR